MVRFEFVHSDANSVQLAGSFNSWQPQTMRKQQNPDKALFTLELDLSPGDYEYKFVVDGNWEHDPDQECRENEVGSWNNFVSIDSLKEPQKSFEVERKFAVPKNYSGLLADYGFNRDENVESIRDEYFDTRDYDLLRRDHWLRKRQEKWQLKKRVEDGVYEEIEDEDRIDAVLKNLKQDFEWERCVKFAEIETKRSKFRMNDVIIDVDETNWGFVVGEIEICVENKDQIAETLRKIDDIAKDLGKNFLCFNFLS